MTIDTPPVGDTSLRIANMAALAAAFGAPPRLPSYTVATLPAAGTSARIVFCSNARMFNGAGTQEASGSGSGGLVTDNGTAWKIAGTNITVAA